MASTLRELLNAGKLVVAPGCYDAITARAIDHAGFPAIYMTGGGTSAAWGFPDYGLLTMTEMVANAARIAAVAKVPVIADADTGYGNELNVIRTVQEYARAGVAAIHIEDQQFPKRCGFMSNKALIPLEEYVTKMRAAADARPHADFLVIARTDSRAELGLEEAVRRVNAALDAGADIGFVEAPQSMEEIRAVPRLVKGPCLLNVVQGSTSPALDLREIEAMGYAVAILPGVLMRTVVGACDEALAHVKAHHSLPPPPTALPSVAKFLGRMGGEEWDIIRERYAAPKPDR